MAIKILIVDDLGDMRAVLGMTLARMGWEVLEAGNGIEAVEMVNLHQPDMVMMDYNMPLMNGIEACRQIKSNPDSVNIPVIIYTGAYASDVKGAATAAGANAFLTKPILPADLRAAVEKIYKESQQANVR